MAKDMGEFTVGEIPEPVVVGFETQDGTPIDITGYTARWVFEIGDNAVEKVAEVTDGPAGEATYTWEDGDLDSAGVLRAQMWVGNSATRLASEKYVGDVRAGVGPVPNI